MHRRAFLDLAASAAAALAFEAQTRALSDESKDPVRYPNPDVQVLDARFGKYVVWNAAVERLYTGCRWAEGPVWFGDGRYAQNTTAQSRS